MQVVRVAWFRLHTQDHLSLVGELNRIPSQVQHHLAQTYRIADHELRQFGRNETGQFQVLLMRSHRQRLDGLPQMVSQVEFH